MFQTNLYSKSKQTLHIQLVFSLNRAVYEAIVEKYGTSGQATDNIMTQAHFTLDT
jgi:hypothetical protein